MSLDRGAGAGMFSCGLHRSSFISSVHRLQLNEGEGEKSKSGPGLEEKNTTVKEWGVEKKTLACSKAATKKRTSTDQPFPHTVV